MRLLTLVLLLPSIAWGAYVPAYTILADLQDFEVHSNGGYKQTHERSIRIDTPQGIDQYGQAKISYDGKRDKLEIVEAYTVKPNGERVLVSPDRIKRVSESTDDMAPYFSDQMTAIIIFPQVEVGSQLYYKSVVVEAEGVIQGRFSDITPFTPHRKYEKASVSLTHSADMPIQAYSRGLTGEKTTLSDGRIRYRYDYKQDTAYPFEPMQVLYEDFAPVVQFSNYKDYADLAKVTQDLFQPKTQVTPNIKKLAERLTVGANTPKQKAQRVYDWVSKNIRYVGIDVGASGFEPHFADDILENRYGDCKDHATILESLLQAVGIASSPVLIRTENSYVLPHLAGNYYFDHVITYVPEFDLYLDSTAQFTEFGTLPSEDMGKPVLVTQSGEVRQTPATNPKHDYTITHTKLQLKPDGSIVGSAKYVPYGYFTTNSRAKQFANENRDTQSVVDAFLHRYQETGTGEIEHGDPSNLSEQWVVATKFKLDPVINMPGPSAFSIPTGLTPGFIKSASSVKPYENRRFPYECGSSRHVEVIELSFPKGIEITRIPKDMNASTGQQSYHSTYKLSDGILRVTRDMSSNTKTDSCQPSSLTEKNRMYMLGRIKADLRGQVFVD